MEKVVGQSLQESEKARPLNAILGNTNPILLFLLKNSCADDTSSFFCYTIPASERKGTEAIPLQ